MKELVLSYNFDKPYVYSGSKEDTYVNLLLEVKPGEELRKEEYAVKGTDFCIVLDVSGSMNEYIEGKITKLETAVKSTKNLYQFLTPEDSISLIIYHSYPVVILDHAKNLTEEQFNDAVEKAYSESGATNISAALAKAREILKINTGNTKKIIFLTDGLPVEDREEDGIREGALIAEENISITALGIGNDFNYSFIEKIVKPGRGTTDWIKNASQSIQVFESALKRSKSVVVNEIEIEIKVSEKVRVNDYYRAVPETTYYGKMELDKERIYKIKLDDIENNRFYQYVFEIAIPSARNKYDGKFRVMSAKLSYHIPATNERKEQNVDIVIDMTSDYEKSNYEYQSVKDIVQRCNIKRLDDYLNEYINKNNDRGVLKTLDEIIERAEEIGEDEIAENYRKIKEQYIITKNIPNDLLIAASNSSTKINDEGFITDEEDLDSLYNDIF
ncbi:vWA domain-containing protein [Marinitoga aeolica]|uniref:VWA domain-containing protein n=1 Tax=Marinitoga aeolica TaxID=2809031 RepID=A0ABY8PRB7_9BACT|nr:VWA domain-containing protein [Marinitoga aeolica]WGS65185.1 VWA domain-containing protein [Marinitoga aeolica]